MIQNTSNTKLLLTGASGFLGSAIVEACDEAGVRVRSLGRRDCKHLDDYHEIDLVNGPIPSAIFPGIETVIHCAGLAHQFGTDGNNDSAFHAVNVVAVENTIRAAAANGVQRFVLISSSGVYGPSDSQQDENSDCKPIGPYAESKHAGEQVAIEAARESGIQLIILRMTTLYGEGDIGNVSRLLKALEQRKFVAIGKGTNQKSLIHKSDAANACLIAAKNPLAGETSTSENIKVYNVAAEPVAMSEVLDGLQSSLHCKSPIRIPAGLVTLFSGTLSAICFGKGPFARIHKTIKKWLANDVFDGAKFSNDYGFQAKVALKDGLARQVAHHKSNSPIVVRQSLLKRAFDFGLSAFLILLFAIPMLVIAILIKATSKGPILFWSNRVGINGKTFPMAKFRTMRTDTPEVATHLLGNAKSYITSVGRILRKTSLDELPQLFNILTGQMSFVGPRPSLPSQIELNEMREHLGVTKVKPGITGWAAVNGRDELLCPEKVEFDRQYIERKSFAFDLKIIFLTALTVLKRDGVKQADESGKQAYIVLQKSESNSAVIATPDTLMSVVNAFRGQQRRIVCLRVDEKLDSAQVVAAAGNATQLIFVSRESEELSTSNAIEHSLVSKGELDTITLNVRSKSLAEQIHHDSKYILDCMSGRKPKIAAPALTEQSGV